MNELRQKRKREEIDPSLLTPSPTASLPPSLTYLNVRATADFTFAPLPPSLKTLKLGYPLLHNPPIPSFPPSLTSLDLYSSSFPLPPLPPSLKKLSFFATNMKPSPILESPFPPSLTTLKLPLDLESKFSNFPPNLQKIRIGNTDYAPLPSSLRTLSFEGRENTRPIPSLPPSLTKLTLSPFFHGDCPPLPPSLLSLATPIPLPPSSIPLLPHLHTLAFRLLDKEMGPPSPISVPPSIFTLAMSERFYCDSASLPPNITHLFLSTKMPSLPPSLTYLALTEEFNEPISALPPSLTTLEIGHAFNHPLPPLPTTLKHLLIGQNFNYPLNLQNLNRYSP